MHLVSSLKREWAFPLRFFYANSIANYRLLLLSLWRCLPCQLMSLDPPRELSHPTETSPQKDQCSIMLTLKIMPMPGIAEAPSSEGTNRDAARELPSLCSAVPAPFPFCCFLSRQGKRLVLSQGKDAIPSQSEPWWIQPSHSKGCGK